MEDICREPVAPCRSSDVDIDFNSEKRQQVKEYIERRYNINGRSRVFSAGTFTTLRAKAAIRDIARVMGVPFSVVNYCTAMIEETDSDEYTGLFINGFNNRKFGDFINTYPNLFEQIRTIMFQPRSSSIHASALLVTPSECDGEAMDCWDYTPIKKMGGVLVSEFSGYDLDACGLLKNDCLATKELSKLQDAFALTKSAYGVSITLKELALSSLNDPDVFAIFCRGFTQDIFQFSSKGMTRFVKEMQPSNIEDLIAANALYRPATLENGSVTAYVDCKRGDRAPVYLWGTYDALKDTYGQIVYQEQVAVIVRKVGGFSLSDGVKLIKLISKKKIDQIQAMQQKFMEGAQKNGCPTEDAEAIWRTIEACGSYLFNRSHAASYAITAYASAYLKAKYPTAFYTVSLEHADDDEVAAIISEMEQCSNVRLVPPEINHSGNSFHTNFETDEIFWSLEKIQMLGPKAVDWIVEERQKNGDFEGIENFINRIFKYKLKKYEYWDDPDNPNEERRCPVTALHIKNLILSGCFDKTEGLQSGVERYAILQKAAQILGFKIAEQDFPANLIDKHYFWSQQQIALSGVGAIDYRRIYDNLPDRKAFSRYGGYKSFPEVAEPASDGARLTTIATVVDMTEKQFTSTRTGNIETMLVMTMQQNKETCECVVWPEDYERLHDELTASKKRVVALTGIVKFSQYSGHNALQLIKSSKFEIL